MAQTEQAKILYELLRRDASKKTNTFLDTLQTQVEHVDYTQDPLLKHNVIEDEDESESDSDSDSDSESDVSMCELTLPPNPPVSPKLSRPVSPSAEVETISIDLSKPMEWVPIVESKVETKAEKDTKEIVIELDTETNYSKMSIKQLKDILTSKGVKHRNNMKKDELLDLVKETDGEVTI